MFLFFYGLLRATFEEVTEANKEVARAEEERDQERQKRQEVEKKLATDEQHAALKEVLAEALREGEQLRRSSPSNEEAVEWVEKIKGLLLRAFFDTSEAEVFASDEGLAPLYYADPVLRHAETPAQKWIRQRLQRLTNLIERTDSLQIRPGFNGRDYIVPD